MKKRIFCIIALFSTLSTMAEQIPTFINFSTSADALLLTSPDHQLGIAVDDHDHQAVIMATQCLCNDFKAVTGRSPRLQKSKADIIIGTMGKSSAIDRLIRQGVIDRKELLGKWEKYIITSHDGKLIIAGSDRRGTVYGIYELSRQIGVSPWYWWADVPTPHHDTIFFKPGTYTDGEPTVKYRGIFINDEDWGLKPWASKNYEKELGDIGPKTYARVCELLLRLKANMLAPAMHTCTGAFYSHPASKTVCDSFGIIITTSHCEPLLLNNAAKSEWDQERDGDWNYKTNKETIIRKWNNRLSEASQYENIYTVAMRGLHDAGLRGNLPMEERVSLIEQVIQDQRQLLQQHKQEQPEQIPQIFVPYKETMDIYENDLQVPDDITLVWVDDNYGYLKRVSSPEEQKRGGRAGVYYHLSYLGAPHDYLWLNTTPPVLMYEELKKAYDTGADRYWLLNVGDIKPMELGLQTFMDMAWNIHDFNFVRANEHQTQFLARLFGQQYAKRFQTMLDEYYRLAWSRKPEFMGWEYEWDDKEHTGLKSTEFSFTNYNDAQQRLADYQRISDEAERLSDGSAAYYELVQFPVQAACQMNRKFLMAQLSHERQRNGESAQALWAAHQMEAAYDSVNVLNRRYNEQLNGKWRGIMDLSPGFCALYQEKPAVPVIEGVKEEPVDLTPRHEPLQDCCLLHLAAYDAKSDDARLITGVGYDWQAIQLGEATYTFPAVSRDTLEVTLYTLPFWPLYQGKSNAISITVDDTEPQVFENLFAEYSRTWKDQVLRNGAICHLRFAVDKTKSTHSIHFKALDSGQILQRVIINWGGLKNTYVGPSLKK